MSDEVTVVPADWQIYIYIIYCIVYIVGTRAVCVYVYFDSCYAADKPVVWVRRRTGWFSLNINTFLPDPLTSQALTQGV